MKLFELLSILQKVSNESQVPVYFVGGLPRDKVLKKIDKLGDIDLTTGDKRVTQIAKDFAFELRKYTPLHEKQAADGHISLHMPSLKVDFSSNFLCPNIQNILKSKGINPTPLNCEMWSRDFTCNSLLMSLDFLKINDVTKRGMKDIQSKTLNTVLDPGNTFKYNTNRIIRIVYMAAKLDFNVSNDIIEWVKKEGKQFINQSSQEYLSKNIDKALLYDADKVSYLLNQMDLWFSVPTTEKLMPYYRANAGKNRLIRGM